MASKKILISGDVNGKLSALFKRVAAVNKSNGPFDMLLCTGRFLADAGKCFDCLCYPLKLPALDWCRKLHSTGSTVSDHLESAPSHTKQMP